MEHQNDYCDHRPHQYPAKKEVRIYIILQRHFMHGNKAANCCIEGTENIRLKNSDKNSPDILSIQNYLDKFVHIFLLQTCLDKIVLGWTCWIMLNVISSPIYLVKLFFMRIDFIASIFKPGACGQRP